MGRLMAIQSHMKSLIWSTVRFLPGDVILALLKRMLVRFQSNSNSSLFLQWFNSAIAFHGDVISDDLALQQQSRETIRILEDQIDARSAMLRLQGTVELVLYQNGSVEQMKTQIVEDEAEISEGSTGMSSDEGDFDFDDA